MKNAIITGSSRGIGRATALTLAAEGYKVWLSGRNLLELEDLKREIHAKGGEANIDQVDFLVPDQVISYALKLKTEALDFAVLVNNVGQYLPDELMGQDCFLEQQMQVNFYAPYQLTQALLPQFVSQKKGYIINICSVVNRFPRTNAASYTIAKTAFFAYHQLLHESLRDKGVKVTALLPASVNTSSWDGIEGPKEQFIQAADIATIISSLLKLSSGAVPSSIDIATSHLEY
jgi:short-subunit dehydrogenase